MEGTEETLEKKLLNENDVILRSIGELLEKVNKEIGDLQKGEDNNGK